MSHVSASLRYKILSRDNFRCQYCGRGVGEEVTLHVDHVVPRCEGGTNDPSNLKASCADCNHGKGPHPGNPNFKKRTSKPQSAAFMCEFCHSNIADHMSCDGNWDKKLTNGSPAWRFICAECNLPGTNYEYAIPLRDLSSDDKVANWREHLSEKIWFVRAYFDSKVSLLKAQPRAHDTQHF